MPFEKGKVPPGATPFKAGEDERRNLDGRPTGSKNRSTIVKKWLEIETEEVNPLTGATEKLSQEDFITLQQIKEAKGKTSAMSGPAYKNLMDSAYGSPKAEIEHSGLPEAQPAPVVNVYHTAPKLSSNENEVED